MSFPEAKVRERRRPVRGFAPSVVIIFGGVRFGVKEKVGAGNGNLMKLSSKAENMRNHTNC